MFGRLLKEESGAALGMAIMVMVLVGVMGAGLLTFVQRDLETVVEVNQGQKAFEMADAGIKAAERQLKSDSTSSKYSGTAADDVQWSSGVSNPSGCVSLGTSGMCLNNLDGNGSTPDMVNVTIEYRSLTTDYKVVSTGGYGGEAKRRVEAIYEGANSTGVSSSYFTRTNLTIRGSAKTSGVSFFALGNAKVQGNADIGNATDTYFKKWAETNDGFTYPNQYNVTARPSDKAGIAALGLLDLSAANASAQAKVAKGTRSFDSTPSGTPNLRTVASGLSGSGKIAFPFDTVEDANDIEALRKRAKALEALTGYDYYRDGVSGGQTISSWPANSDYDTVVFYEFASYSSTNNVSYTANGTCTPPQHKGVIVVNRGNFSVAGSTQFSGGILVYGGGTPDVDKGTYTSTGNGCLSGYANSTGLLDIGGTPSAGAVPTLSSLPALSDSMELVSWRELYQ